MAAPMDVSDNLLMEEVVEHGSVKDMFRELDEIQELITSLTSIYDNDVAVEKCFERFLVILDCYQEQPHLIDPYLETMIQLLLDNIRGPGMPQKVIHLSFHQLYIITKTRGHKVVIRHLPHEVSDFEPTLALLNCQSLTDYKTWETRYMLLLWLSIICIIPFSMSLLDSNIDQEPIADRIMNTAKVYLNVSDKSRDAAALLISKFVTRPDMKETRLPEFFDWSLLSLNNIDSDTISGMTSLSGILSTLALLFKHGKRDDLVNYAPTLLQALSEYNLNTVNNTLLRKLHMKLMQRIGLTFLKPKIAVWRYQRGCRSISKNLGTAPQTETETDSETQSDDIDDEGYEIPDQMEDVIEHLLTGLKDKDTIVRWSAAKGIGRVTGRLPKQLADEVVGSVLDNFTLRDMDGAWHGGCLALAELGRRGLLLPERLGEVLPVVMKALVYDERRGSCSVGAHVRDAACYVCWAFARAYDPDQIELYVNDIASALLITAIFDREPNCRRAASAAFQENVGRQGTFSHGIDIVTTVDYYAVGNRVNAFTTLGLYVAGFHEYTKPLIEHLVTYKSQHWDECIRQLTAQSLHDLIQLAPIQLVNQAVSHLLPMTTGIDLDGRHGALLALAEIIHGLHTLNRLYIISETYIHSILCIPFKLQQAQYFRGLGGEMMRPAVCQLILRVSQCQLVLPVDTIIHWLHILNDNIQYIDKEYNIQTAAVKALAQFLSMYCMISDGTLKPEIEYDRPLIQTYLNGLHAPLEVNRIGYSLAVASLPATLLKGQLSKVMCTLLNAVKVKPEARYTEARKVLLTSISRVCQTVGVASSDSPGDDYVGPTLLAEVYSTCLSAMYDYTVDSRGDVGAGVREAAMCTLSDVIILTLQSDCADFISPQLSQQIISCLIQQSAEKIDRTRAVAGCILLKLLHLNNPAVPHIPHRTRLQQILPVETGKTRINWAAPSDVFPRIIQMLDLDCYSYSVLLGLTVSVGGLTESLVKHSWLCLQQYIQTLSADLDKLNRFCDLIIKVFEDHSKLDRVTVPMFKMLDLMFTNDCNQLFEHCEDCHFPLRILQQCKKEIQKCGEPSKIVASINVLCGLLQFQETQRSSLNRLVLFLCHKYPRVRKQTASQLFEAMLVYDDICSVDVMEMVMAILGDTNWDIELKLLRPIRDNLCDLLSIPRPVIVKTSN